MKLIEKFASMGQSKKDEIEKLLTDIVESLDVPPTKYVEAENHYKAVGEWLDHEDSPLAPYKPVIYAQGSFALGTVIKPAEGSDYDIDAVCVLENPPNNITQQRLAMLVGERLKQHKKYAKMLDPATGGRRCWTLKYSDDSKFHMDILPSIPDNYQWLIDLGVDQEIAKKSICITDRTTWNKATDWPKSNPKGYWIWFEKIMQPIFNEITEEFKKKANVQDVPKYHISTPLQQVIKILKHHRDTFYKDNEHKPISIIINTLAAKSYEGQKSIFASFVGIISKMREFIENKNNEWWIENPVNPQENFADKWNEVPEKQKIFFDWIDKTEQGILKIINDLGFNSIDTYLTENYGINIANEVLQKKILRDQIIFTSALHEDIPETEYHTIDYATYVQEPEWILDLQPNSRSVTVVTRQNGFRSATYSKGPIAVVKGRDLFFTAFVKGIAPPFEIKWQVVNTGTEARLANALRGGFYYGSGKFGEDHKESTLYRGIHWVECFVIKNEVCHARSGKIKIKILDHY